MKKYKTILIDDEQLGLDVLQHYFERYPQFDIVEIFNQSTEAFQYLKTNEVDLVFTDIAMPEISGTELVALISGKTRFVMVTSYTEYAIKSFELNVVDYLLKPVSFERFAMTIQRFEEEMNHKNTLGERQGDDSFFVKEGEEFVKVFVKDIDYIEGMKDYAKIVCGKNYYMVLKTLKSLETILAPFQFLRIHKSYIIPLTKVDQYGSGVVFVNSNKLPVGNNYKEGLRLYLTEKQL